jgi:hypothetical protein
MRCRTQRMLVPANATCIHNYRIASGLPTNLELSS